jgi:steroid 5-alpha reductase family enzyme
MSLLISWLILSISVWIAASIVPGVQVKGFGGAIVVAAIFGILNWAIGWKSLAQQDWRYTMLHDSMPKLWFITNLFGINMFPTLIVFAGLVPAYLTTAEHGALTILTFVGAAVCIGAAVLQIASDAQLRRFRLDAAHAGRSVGNGLWKYSRHPNYLGEVSFWWGVWLISLSVLPQYWWTIIAPVLMSLMFLFISIPMMEKRLLASRPDYAEYRRRTSALLLLPPSKQRDSEQAPDVV